MPSTNTAPRRIAVVLDGPGTPRWQQRTVALLGESPVLEVVSVQLAGAARRGALARALASIERRLFRPGPDALEPVALDPVTAASGEGGERDGALVVWLSEHPLPADEDRELLFLRHGRRRETAEQAFRRAVLRGHPSVETEALLRRGEETALVERTVSGARPFSTTLSRDKALWKIAPMVVRAAERAAAANTPAQPAQPPSGAPSTAELIVRAPWRWARVVAARLLFVRPWQIRVRERGAEPTGGWDSRRSILAARPGHLYADPCIFEHEGRHHLFCEELPPGQWRAVISHSELGAGDGLAAAPVPVLEEPHHLSYPFVFAHEGEVFMISETSAQQRVDLYRATDFPRAWRHEATLLEGLVASDATLLAEGGRLWLFVGVAAPHATMLDELHLFSAVALRGPWQAHPLNPVVSDVSCARPAGAIQRWGSRLVRPGQDCSRRYGGAVSFREIDELSIESYAEHEIARLEPGDLGDARATHTYAADERYEAVDFRRRQWRLKPRRGRPGAAPKRP
jgi:hypothetical protein